MWAHFQKAILEGTEGLGPPFAQNVDVDADLELLPVQGSAALGLVTGESWDYFPCRPHPDGSEGRTV